MHDPETDQDVDAVRVRTRSTSRLQLGRASMPGSQLSRKVYRVEDLTMRLYSLNTAATFGLISEEGVSFRSKHQHQRSRPAQRPQHSQLHDLRISSRAPSTSLDLSQICNSFLALRVGYRPPLHLSIIRHAVAFLRGHDRTKLKTSCLGLQQVAYCVFEESFFARIWLASPSSLPRRRSWWDFFLFLALHFERMRCVQLHSSCKSSQCLLAQFALFCCELPYTPSVGLAMWEDGCVFVGVC